MYIHVKLLEEVQSLPAQWLYSRNLGITFPAKNYKKLKIYSQIEHFFCFEVINSHSSWNITSMEKWRPLSIRPIKGPEICFWTLRVSSLKSPRNFTQVAGLIFVLTQSWELSNWGQLRPIKRSIIDFRALKLSPLDSLWNSALEWWSPFCSSSKLKIRLIFRCQLYDVIKIS